MKKQILLVALSMLCLTACAHKEVVEVTDLPNQAQNILSTYFANDPILLLTVEHFGIAREYTVSFQSGGKIEFDYEGNWTEISYLPNVPDGLVPALILESVAQKFPGQLIIDISKELTGYEVELSSHIELKYNRNFELISIEN